MSSSRMDKIGTIFVYYISCKITVTRALNFPKRRKSKKVNGHQRPTCCYCRCEIPECDGPNPEGRTYEPKWLRFTTPYRNDTNQPRKCLRYAALSGPLTNGTHCSSSGFNQSATEWCRSNWVFEDFENTIGKEVRINGSITLLW